MKRTATAALFLLSEAAIVVADVATFTSPGVELPHHKAASIASVALLSLTSL